MTIDKPPIVVGAPNWDNMSASNVGLLYEYEYDSGWTEVDTIWADDAQTSDVYGRRVALDGDRCAASAVLEDELGANAGAVYVNDHGFSGWKVKLKVTASLPASPEEAVILAICQRLRMYDPATGKWLTRDPIGYLAGDFNIYQYVRSSPWKYLDPWGTDSQCGPGICSIACSHWQQVPTPTRTCPPNPVWMPTLTQIIGAIQVIGGVSEIAVASALLAIPGAQAFGIIGSVHGFDQTLAGIRTLSTGTIKQTFLYEGTKYVTDSETIAGIVDFSAGLVGPAKFVRLTAAEKYAVGIVDDLGLTFADDVAYRVAGSADDLKARFDDFIKANPRATPTEIREHAMWLLTGESGILPACDHLGAAAFTNPEHRMIAEYLESLGRKTSPMPQWIDETHRFRKGDGFVDGLEHEFKTLKPDSTVDRLIDAVKESKSGMGQARDIVINVRGTAISKEEALAALDRMRYNPQIGGTGKIDAITVIGDGWAVVDEFTWAPAK